MQTHGRNIINWPRGKTNTHFHKLSQTNCKFLLKTVDKFKVFFCAVIDCEKIRRQQVERSIVELCAVSYAYANGEQ